jgi:hypothetical protein
MKQLGMNSTVRDRVLQIRTSTEEIHLYAYPRTGSHFLIYCLRGLYDLITFEQPQDHNSEATAREQELDPHALYALELREDGAAHQPIWLNATPNGVHGLPVLSTNRRIIVIREPQATIYSLYRVNRDRWNGQVKGLAESALWIEESLARYHDFYQRAFAIKDTDPTRTCLVRYEELSASPMALAALAAFIERPTKLSAEFVFWATSFGRFTLARAERTFYPAGDDAAYRSDRLWERLCSSIDPIRWNGFGYPTMPEPTGRITV